MMDVLWLEAFDREIQFYNEQDPEFTVEFNRSPVQEIQKIPEEPTIISIRTHSNPGSQISDSFRTVISRSTGYDHLLEPAWPRQRAYLPEYASEAVADFNLMATRVLLRKLPAQQQAIERFERDNLVGKEIGTARVGIVGVGSIGKHTARLLDPLVEDLFLYDIEPDPGWAASLGASYCKLEELLEKSEVVIACLPLTSGTRDLLDYSAWERLGPGGYFVNSGRGEVAPPGDLLKALEEGLLDSIFLDVHYGEAVLRRNLRQGKAPGECEDPVEADSLRLVRRSDVVASPHNAFNTRQATRKKVDQTITVIRQVLETGTVPSRFRVPETENFEP